MDIEQNQTVPNPPQTLSQEDMLKEILENSRKTKNYMMWQLYITIILIVLPLLVMVVLIPMVMKSLGSLGAIYGGSLLQ